MSFLILVCRARFEAAFGAPVADYSSVRRQFSERPFDPIVGSALPGELLADPSLATLSSDLGSVFVRPYDKVKRSPQNDVVMTNARMSAPSGQRRGGRKMRLQRVHDINSLDDIVNGRNTQQFDLEMWKNVRYDTIDVLPQTDEMLK